MDDVLLDLPSLDRDVRRAAERVERLRRALRAPEGRADARASDPFSDVRHVAGQSTYRALAALDPSPHRDGILRWIHELLQTRIAWDLELDEADAIHRVDERLSKSAAESPRGPAPTFVEAWSGVVGALDRALDRVAELAAPIAAVRKERRVRWFEAAHRLGLAHPMALASPLTIEKLEAGAQQLLDATDPIAKEILGDAARKKSGAWRAEDAIELALAKEAHEGWPAKLSARWLGEAFGPLALRAFEPRHLPRALGGASFLLAAVQWGRSLRASSAPRSLAFALAHDPYPTMDLRFGFAIAIATADPVFQRRVLGLPARIANAQSRALQIALLAGARTIAARFLLAARPERDPSAFEELTQRVFGAPLPPALAEAWPEPRPSEPAHLLAALGAHAFVDRLRQRFDEDWFANPRAGAHLAQIGCAPAWDPDVPDDDAPETIGRAFEEALG